MSRRNQWKEMREDVLGKAKTVEERETIPEIACTFCKNFSENAYASDGRGTCKVLKVGSNILADPPVLVTDGKNGYITYFNRDASKCPHFEKMEFIDKDGNECADPQYRRAQRQMEKAK